MKKETSQNPPPPVRIPHRRADRPRLRVARVDGSRYAGRPHALPTAPTATRLARFAAGLTIQAAAQAAGVSMTRASLAERGVKVDPAALAALDKAIKRIAARRAS